MFHIVAFHNRQPPLHRLAVVVQPLCIQFCHLARHKCVRNDIEATVIQRDFQRRRAVVAADSYVEAAEGLASSDCFQANNIPIAFHQRKVQEARIGCPREHIQRFRQEVNTPICNRPAFLPALLQLVQMQEYAQRWVCLHPLAGILRRILFVDFIDKRQFAVIHRRIAAAFEHLVSKPIFADQHTVQHIPHRGHHQQQTVRGFVQRPAHLLDGIIGAHLMQLIQYAPRRPQTVKQRRTV